MPQLFSFERKYYLLIDVGYASLKKHHGDGSTLFKYSHYNII